MSKYEKSYVREEEGSYHRREIEPIAPREEKNYTTHHETSYQIVPKPSSGASSKLAKTTHQKPLVGVGSSDDENYEEWTTSKRKVNHKTRQVETRVSRQLLVEDGKVIADSGPQVTTRIKEDNKVEECEKEKTPKNKSKFDAISGAPEAAGETSGRVLGEKKEIQRVSREVREENMQYHDERFKELTGQDVHRRAIKAPHELITINDKSHHSASAPRGKMVHYSNKGKKYQDTDEILEVAKLAIDGSITKEVKRTRHHEECSEDELPDEKGEAEALRDEPIVTRSSRRHVDYVNDFDDTATPSCSSDDELEGDAQAIRRHKAAKKLHSSAPSHKHQHQHSGKQDDEAFPRYEIDPLLNSLRDEDFRPVGSTSDRHSSLGRHSGKHEKEVPLVRREKEASSDSDDNHRHRHQHQHRRAQRQRSPSPVPVVEVPEEYRVNRQRLMGANKQSTHQRERSFSPAANRNSHRRDHDASVQAHLTDEEIERSSVNSHEKQTRHLQRQSTTNSSRNYYYGKPKHQHRQRAPSVSSSSSSSVSSAGDKQRKSGVRSRDSGFRSPHSRRRPETPLSTNSAGQQQIYSVSNKAKQQRPISPTGSLGQRSVKTTTTTLSAGLQDRPRSRQQQQQRQQQRADSGKSPSGGEKVASGEHSPATADTKQQQQQQQTDEDWRSLDTVSLASLGANATTIRVPYRGDIMEERQDHAGRSSEWEDNRSRATERQNGSSNKHFNYRTIIANVQPAPIVPRQQVIDAYNVRVIQHKSPFLDQIQPITSMSDLSSSIARLEQLSSDLSSLSTAKRAPASASASTETNTNHQPAPKVTDNNNEANFNLGQFMKQKPAPFQVYTSSNIDSDENADNGDADDTAIEEDNVSLVSTCSLRSSKTYHIRTQDSTLKSEQALEDCVINGADDDLNDASDFPVESIEFVAREQQQRGSASSLHDDGDEASDRKRPRAWMFDLRDNSSTAIVAPVRPSEPEVPKVDAKTEELARSRGGRSYYLELIDKEPRAKKVNENLYTRWSSQNALNSGRKPSSSDSSATNSQEADSRKSRHPTLSKSNAENKQQPPKQHQQRQSRPPSVTPAAYGDTKLAPRRQLPFSGPPPQLGIRSKSVSCLASSTRPTKYSIYGGFKKPDADKKPVPRLSYSRAIGPKSQRQIDNQPKTPSRYLKMK